MHCHLRLPDANSKFFWASGHQRDSDSLLPANCVEVLKIRYFSPKVFWGEPQNFTAFSKLDRPYYLAKFC